MPELLFRISLESWARKQDPSQPGRRSSSSRGAPGLLLDFLPGLPAFTLLALPVSMPSPRDLPVSPCAWDPCPLVCSSSRKSLLDATAFPKAVLGHVLLSTPSPTKTTEGRCLNTLCAPAHGSPGHPCPLKMPHSLRLCPACVCMCACVVSCLDCKPPWAGTPV